MLSVCQCEIFENMNVVVRGGERGSQPILLKSHLVWSKGPSEVTENNWQMSVVSSAVIPSMTPPRPAVWRILATRCVFQGGYDQAADTAGHEISGWWCRLVAEGQKRKAFCSRCRCGRSGICQPLVMVLVKSRREQNINEQIFQVSSRCSCNLYLTLWAARGRLSNNDTSIAIRRQVQSALVHLQQYPLKEG